MTRTNLTRTCWIVALLSLGAFPATAICQEKATDKPSERSARNQFASAIEHGRTILRGLVNAGEAPGVGVSVAVCGRIVWSEGIGLANLEYRVPVSTETRFGLGSISKTFTMAAVMALVDDGLLDLDAPVERYLPDFPYKGKGITIRRLAAHQSGLSDAFAVEHNQTTEHFPTIDTAYQHIKHGAIEYEPGTRVEYATGLHTIIARAMEVVTGQTYLQIMKERIFGPVGMTGTAPNDRRRLIPNRTGFYVKTDSGTFENGPFFDPSFKLPGAGFLATADDVARFGAALLRPGILSNRAREQMFRPVPLGNGASTEFALGLRYSEKDGQVILHQPGGGIGISTWLFIYPAEDLVIALLSNVPTGPMGGRTHREIAKAFLEAMGRKK